MKIDYFDKNFIKNNKKVLVYILDVNEIRNLQKYSLQEKLDLASKHLMSLLPFNINYDDNNKPVIKNGFVSISHAGNYAVIAYSNDSPIGVDIQPIKLLENWQKICKKFDFSLQKFMNDINSFIKYWTIAESIVKIVGENNLTMLNKIKLQKQNWYEFLEKNYCTFTKKIKNHYLTIATDKIISNFKIKIINIKLL